jgi:hypothetical protein
MLKNSPDRSFEDEFSTPKGQSEVERVLQMKMRLELQLRAKKERIKKEML